MQHFTLKREHKKTAWRHRADFFPLKAQNKMGARKGNNYKRHRFIRLEVKGQVVGSSSGRK